MNEESRIALESRVQDILAGTPGPRAGAGLLALICQDAEARGIVGEMLSVQRLARESAGCDVEDEHVADSLARTLAAMRAMPQAENARSATPGRAGLRQLKARVAWPLRIAAALVIASSLYAAVMAHNDSTLLREQLAGMGEKIESISLREPTAQELTGMRKVWREVSQGVEGARPWVYLNNGDGEFGYLPVDHRAEAPAGLVLLQCVIVGPDRQEVRKMRLLLPARQRVRVVLAEAGTLDGQPVNLDVSGVADRIGVDLRIGSDSASAVGIRGRTRVDGQMTEAGQFRFMGRTMKVFLQAIALDKNVT